MKLARLFKKVEDFFGMDEEQRSHKAKKVQKLSSSLSDKIESVKQRIQDSTSKRKKEKLKKKLEVLQKLEKKLIKEQEKQDG